MSEQNIKPLVFDSHFEKCQCGRATRNVIIGGQMKCPKCVEDILDLLPELLDLLRKSTHILETQSSLLNMKEVQDQVKENNAMLGMFNP